MQKPFSAYDGDDPYIFISSAHQDADIVYPQLQWLYDEGLNIWYDDGISPAASWREELAQAIRGAETVVFMVQLPPLIVNLFPKRRNVLLLIRDQLGVQR